MPDNQSTTKREFNHAKPLPEFSPKEIQRFWSKVDKAPGHGPNGECWIWRGPIAESGYGRFYAQYQWRILAHRVGYKLQHGVDAAPLCVLHSCDNPACVRGDHLKMGTNAENLHECAMKGRKAKGDSHGRRLHPETAPFGIRNGRYTHPEATARGERCGASKLNDADIKAIRAMWETGRFLQRDIGALFDVVDNHIYKILRGEVWSHI